MISKLNFFQDHTMTNNRMQVIQGDITQLKVDCIVNAANTTLLGGGGVDGAIHRAAGPELLQFCRTLDGCATGEAKLTPGFKLPAKYVIHTAGPVWHGGKSHEPELLASCYSESLKLAAKKPDIKTIAFPAISCGVYRYPLEEAIQIAIKETQKFLSEHKHPEQVIFVTFSAQDFKAYQAALVKS